MIIGTAVLAFILCKFCIAKRRRCQQVRTQMINQQGQMRTQQMQMQSPHLMQHQAYSVNQHAYPTHPQQIYPAHPQQVQMGRAQSQERQAAPQAVRGRPHDSCMRQPQAQNQHVDAQINYHENEIMRLKEMIRREEPQQMRREMPINTSESLESSHPMARRPIPVGQPLYERDPSSFSSEYPEI